MNQERMSAAEARALPKPPKKSKYKNKPVIVDGRRYASQLEATHCLKLIEREERVK